MKKILVIDDDQNFLKTMRDVFQSRGYTVVEAEDGEEGLSIIKKEKPDVILLDMVMPKLGGM